MVASKASKGGAEGEGAFSGVCHNNDQNPPRFWQNVAGFWQNVAGYNYSTAWNNVKMAGDAESHSAWRIRLRLVQVLVQVLSGLRGVPLAKPAGALA